MIVRLLTLVQKEAIDGKQYSSSLYFNPILDCNDEWIISNEVCENCVNPDYQWVKDLPVIEYCHKPIIRITGDTINEL